MKCWVHVKKICTHKSVSRISARFCFSTNVNVTEYENMERVNFLQQVKALLNRNILIKRRKKEYNEEIIQPILFVGIVLLIDVVIKTPRPERLPSLTFPETNISTDPSSGDTFLYPPCSEIFVSPDNTSIPYVDSWMQSIVSEISGSPTYETFTTEENAENKYRSVARSFEGKICGVSFNVNGIEAAYSIRLPYDDIPSTENVLASQSQGFCRQLNDEKVAEHNCPVHKYLTTGFLQLQMAIDNTMLSHHGVPVGTRSIKVQMMDKEEELPKIVSKFNDIIIILMAFIIMIAHLGIHIVTEKETKIKDGMLMMGLASGALWLSWAIVYMAMVAGNSAVMVLLMVIFDTFQRSNVILLFICFVLYGASIIALSFMFSTFFNKAKTAGLVITFFMIIMTLIHIPVSLTREPGTIDSSLSPTGLGVMCLLSPFAFTEILDKCFLLDIYIDGFGFDERLNYGKFPMYVPVIMLVVDTVLYALLTVYLDNVLPSEFGTSYPPYYFVLPSYWCPPKHHHSEMRISEDHSTSHQEDIEPVTREIEDMISMRINGLTKQFKSAGKRKIVVDRFSLDIYKNQITCLLGHNGAGKTTLMNMLTGVIPPTSGSATLNGLDITKKLDMEEIRRQCGICPQHDILYPELSCREHLEMFALIKGVPPAQVTEATKKAISDVDLETQLETLSKNLSGGQKRKLSVAIALIGDPKLIFLDEPTAGIDAYSRRHLWSLLKQKKENRVILLTTHFMDEADILADRKVFIRNGKLRCCGSSLFLKNRFGVGYHLTMVAEPTSGHVKIGDTLKSVIPDINLERSHGMEVSYTVPLAEVSKFGAMFEQLDRVSSELGIKSYGVSMTTLEEVFLKLEELDDVDNEEHLATKHKTLEAAEGGVNRVIDPVDKDSITKSVVSGSALRKQRFLALMKIRFLQMLRNRYAILWQLVVPMVLVIGALVLAKVMVQTHLFPSPKDGVAMEFLSSLYDNVLACDHGAQSACYPDASKFLIYYNKTRTDQQNVFNDLEMRLSTEGHQTGSRNPSDISPHFFGLKMNSVSNTSYLTGYTALYNDSAVHSLPIIVSAASQSLFTRHGSGVVLQAYSKPWPQLEVTTKAVDFWYFISIFAIVTMFGYAFALMLPEFAAEAVQDREKRLRGQLRISGLDFSLYWGTTFLSDLAACMTPFFVITIVILSLQIEGLNSAGSLGALMLLLFANIPFNIIMILVISFMFDKTETCRIWLMGTFVNLVTYPLTAVQLTDLTVSETAVDPVFHIHVAIWLHYFFCVINPTYVISGGLYFILKLHTKSLLAGDGGVVKDSEYFQFDNHIMICVIMPLFYAPWMYWLLRVLDVKKTGGKALEAFPCLSETKSTAKITNDDVISNEDDDVKAERSRVERLVAQGHDLKSHAEENMPVAYTSQLRKEFEKRTSKEKNNNKVAVRNLSVVVEEGEVLGLLGPNGAGKSTAMSMIIGEQTPSCGQVVIGAHDIRSNVLDLTESLGYCPQHDALWDGITLEEHIKCFAAIKGVAPQHLNAVADYYVKSLKLEQHRKKMSKNLSGGTKRKLSYILCTLGSPRLVLMDEPSTGMDPQSKRFLWDTIGSNFRNTTTGGVLTTHYMEEADALCQRVGILVNGELQCLGTTQHLKDTFGSGYILEVKLNVRMAEGSTVEEQMDALETRLKSLFSGLETVERFQERAQYSVPKEEVKSLGSVFSSLEECKKINNLEEYSFSQSTLEQVFLYFAKHQREEGVEENVTGATPSKLTMRPTGSDTNPTEQKLSEQKSSEHKSSEHKPSENNLLERKSPQSSGSQVDSAFIEK